MLYFANTVAGSRSFISRDRANRPSFPNPFTWEHEALGYEAPLLSIDDFNDRDFRARRARSQATKMHRAERYGTGGGRIIILIGNG